MLYADDIQIREGLTASFKFQVLKWTQEQDMAMSMTLLLSTAIGLRKHRIPSDLRS